MSATDIDQERKDRIADEAIVDCYDEAMRWYYYLEGRMTPFAEKCINERSTSGKQRKI